MDKRINTKKNIKKNIKTSRNIINRDINIKIKEIVFEKTVLFVMIMLCTILTGCSRTPKDNNIAMYSEKMSIVCTGFSEYDWVMNILGEEAEAYDVTFLLDSGTDMHSFQPTAEDVTKILDCNLFIYVGGESDEWVTDILENADSSDMHIINLMDILGDSAKTEEIVEGMQGESDGALDEHVWLSIKNAVLFTEAISDEICLMDSGNSTLYKANTDNYISKLLELDEQFNEAAESFGNKPLLVGDRFPFRYLVEDYNITYYAAFAGCEADAEADFDTVIFLADKVDECSLDYIFVIDGSDKSLAQTIIDNTDAKTAEILELNSIQSVTTDMIESGYSYISIMESNLEVIKTAFDIS